MLGKHHSDGCLLLLYTGAAGPSPRAEKPETKTKISSTVHSVGEKRTIIRLARNAHAVVKEEPSTRWIIRRGA